MAKDIRAIKTVGGHEILGVLGRGAMGKVYRVRIPLLNKVAALKCLAPSPRLVETVGIETLKKRFLFEASVIGGIRHPGIVEIWRLGLSNGRPYYVMEYFCRNLGTIMGETYWAETPSRLIRADLAIDYTKEILNGLDRLHTAGIFHRDIKPFNIMLTDRNQPKITDFGLSRRRGEKPAWPERQFIGTRGYAAPEQERAPDAVDARADLYSVGAMLHRMITGLLPAAGGKPGPFPFPNASEPLRSFFEKAIAASPDKRYPDAPAMLADLDRLAAALAQSEDEVCRNRSLQDSTLEEVARKTRIAEKVPNSQEEVVPKRRAKTMFGIDDLGRPVAWSRNTLVKIGEDLVEDRKNGLIWQRSGSRFPVNMEEARHYIAHLNRSREGNRTNWRLPTVNELLTLLQPPDPENVRCIPPVFDSIQDWLWSADRRSRLTNWCVNMDIGFVSSHETTACFFVRAVCDSPT